mmetsp:Transcript_41937/g.91333  ORF Transcript_41937/g.91333 Transcript_41937/m.91333 type:complete len:143 (+) Transcript_41937:418-846(+)
MPPAGCTGHFARLSERSAWVGHKDHVALSLPVTLRECRGSALKLTNQRAEPSIGKAGWRQLWVKRLQLGAHSAGSPTEQSAANEQARAAASVLENREQLFVTAASTAQGWGRPIAAECNENPGQQKQTEIQCCSKIARETGG